MKRLGAVPLPLMKKSNIRRKTSIGAVPYAALMPLMQYKKKHVFRSGPFAPYEKNPA